MAIFNICSLYEYLTPEYMPESKKRIYGLFQAGIISHESLKEHLKPHGYAPAKITQGLWKHKDRDINLKLVVDDFGIRYKNKKDADHLILEF